MASAATQSLPDMAHQQPGPSRRRPSQVLATDYHLDVRQQPRQARMAGAGEKADRRPIDPPPIIRLRIRKPQARHKPADELEDDDLLTPTLTHTLFMFASLVPESSEEEMYDLTGSKSKLVAGSVVSSLFHLKDQSCFVFPDLSVRTEGRWRFKMSLFELGEDGVHFCTDILTDVFQVYSSKRFPGMGKSTELSKAFAQQGLKLRIRRPGSKAEEETEEPAPRQSRKSKALRHPPNALSPVDYAPAPPRRPSAPETAPAPVDPLVSSRKRPYTSYDSGPPHPGGPSHPHHLANPHPHPHAYAPYPSRLSLSASTRAQGLPPHYALDSRRVVSYPHAYPAAVREGPIGERYYATPPADPSAFPPSAHAQRLPPPHVAAAPYPPPYASSVLPVHHSYASQSPSTASTSAFPSQQYRPTSSGLSAPFPQPNSHPVLHDPYPRRSLSPPPILAPIRAFPHPAPYPPPSTAPTPVSPAPAHPTPASAQAATAGYDAATVAAGAALASLCGGGPAGGSQRRATESSVRSTGSEGEEVEMKDAAATGEEEQKQGGPAQSRGSLAMLLGGGGGDGGKEGENRDGEGASTMVDFF